MKSDLGRFIQELRSTIEKVIWKYKLDLFEHAEKQGPASQSMPSVVG